MNRDSTTNFIRALGVTDRDFVCISGGGGKTSLLFCLQKQLSLNGQRSLVSTTAKMMIPEDQENMFFSPVADSRAFADYFLRHVSGSTYLAGGIGNGKATAVSERTLSELAHLLRGKAALLAETDGAARKPYRIRKPHDPGIPLGTTLMIHVIGAELAGAVLSEENLNRCPDCLTGKKADRKQIRELLSENRPPDPEQVPQVLFINKEDLNPEGALDIAEAARGLFDRIYIGSVKENRIREVTGSSYCPLILAAGLSSRMQKIAADKLMMPYRDGTILSETVSNVKALTGMSPVVVVKDNIAVSGDIRTVMNPEPERGQGSSLGLGVSAVRAEYGNKNRILVFLGDQPDVSRRTVCSVLRMSEKYPDKIIIPVFNEKPGHPVVFPARYFNELETLNGETAGKTIIAAHPDQIIRINCDRSTVTDTDTPDDYYRLINRSQENNMETIQKTRKIIIVRGAGDLATGTLLRLHRAGFPVVALDIPEPTVIRRTVSLAPALTQGKADVEGVIGVRCATIPEIYEALKADEIPIVADPGGKLIEELRPRAVVDAILAKRNLGTTRDMAPIVVGLGPGFTAGEDVDAVVETQRGHDLGRVIYKGSAVPNTGVPGMIGGYASERVIHSPAAGVIRVIRDIGSSVTAGETVAEIKTADGESVPVKTEIAGVLRGMIQPGMEVQKGLKIADVDPRDVRSNCWSVSDKANAIAGGVLEAILHLKNRKYPGLSADEIPEPDRPAE